MTVHTEHSITISTYEQNRLSSCLPFQSYMYRPQAILTLPSITIHYRPATNDISHRNVRFKLFRTATVPVHIYPTSQLYRLTS